MLKRFLKIGALAATLVFGVGSALAGIPDGPECRTSSGEKIYIRNYDNRAIAYFYLVKNQLQFDNQTNYWGKLWYYKGYTVLTCNGETKYAGLYERRAN
ncbi:hypothetical protein [Xenorhabdus sp. PB30.3]|uniref:hypothetical protein n=1 Tax=Xenorhabdus sp. PB30.3 TaxID=2788941 RepID=UPI001E58E203|nr:hypothetical protein [Xenorhabdus sp. PB30.3]MCC8379632.1 hypothetical protein [Xenorhabdus sp. PB30.3]